MVPVEEHRQIVRLLFLRPWPRAAGAHHLRDAHAAGALKFNQPPGRQDADLFRWGECPHEPALDRIDRMNRTVEKHPANPVYPVRIKSPCRINPAPGESGLTAALPHPLRLGRGEGRGEVSRPFLSWQARAPKSEARASPPAARRASPAG